MSPFVVIIVAVLVGLFAILSLLPAVLKDSDIDSVVHFKE